MKTISGLFLILGCASLLALLPGCLGSGSSGSGQRGPELSLAEVALREAPFEAGLELLASQVSVALSRNYHQDPSLVLPAGAGDLQRAVRREHGWAWGVADGSGLMPLDFHFRRFKAKVLDRLVVDFPPVEEISLSLVARGQVFLVFPDGRELRGEELRIQEGRVSLDGRTLALPLLGGPP